MSGTGSERVLSNHSAAFESQILQSLALCRVADTHWLYRASVILVMICLLLFFFLSFFHLPVNVTNLKKNVPIIKSYKIH